MSTMKALLLLMYVYIIHFYFYFYFYLWYELSHTSMSVCLTVYLSACLSVCLSVCLVLEGRLSKQQLENEQERERLQTLTAKMEAHITQQARQIEQV